QRVREARHRASLAIERRIPRDELQRALSHPERPRPARVAAAAILDVPAEPGPNEHVVVKSVHAPLALEWVAARFEPAVVVVLRHPLNVIASLLELGLPDRDRALEREPLVRE